MTPYYSAPDGELHQGDVLEVLRDLEAESVQCCVSSPPYWGLRSYGTPPMIWAGDPKCDHEWGAAIRKGLRGPEGDKSTLGRAPRVDGENRLREAQQGQFCQKCGGWLGNLGLEPTPQLFVEHIVEIFREVRRVLRDDGTLWLNLGDSFTSGGRDYRDPGKSAMNGGGRVDGLTEKGTRAPTPVGLKPKDLCMMPARVALALQAEGWYLRSDIIWGKPNPRPESVTDRPTRAHEYVFLLSKSERYFWDQEAVREPQTGNAHSRGNGDTPKGQLAEKGNRSNSSFHLASSALVDLPNGRNLRSVWTIPTEPFKGAHFATFPTEIPRRAILAGTSERGCCPECRAPWKRVVDRYRMHNGHRKDGIGAYRNTSKEAPTSAQGDGHWRYASVAETTGWQPTCNHDLPPVPCVVLDPFAGSGTTCAVARSLGRRWIGIDLSQPYLALARKRIEAVSLPMELSALDEAPTRGHNREKRSEEAICQSP